MYHKKHPFLGENLKVLRVYSKLQQHKIARHFSIDRSTYTNWERGYTEPSYNMLSEMVSFYNNLEGCDLEVDFNMLLSKPLKNTDLSVYRKRIT